MFAEKLFCREKTRNTLRNECSQVAHYTEREPLNLTQCPLNTNRSWSSPTFLFGTPRAPSEDLFCGEPFGISIFKRAIESARQKTGKGHQVSCRFKPPHSIKSSPCCHWPAHAKLRDCPFFSPVTLRGSFSTLAPKNPDWSEQGLLSPPPSPPELQQDRNQWNVVAGSQTPGRFRALLWHDWHWTSGVKPACWVGKGLSAQEGGCGGISPWTSVWLPVRLAVRAWCVLCGKASEGPHGVWFQRWGRCAYTVELAKPADPEGTEGVAWGGEAELQGAAWVLAVDKSAASQAPISLSTPGLTLASLHSLPTHLLAIEM